MDPREYVEEIDFQKYWLVLKRRWLVITVVFSAITSLAYAYTARQESVYQAQGKLLIQPDRTPSLTGLENPLGEVDALTTQSNPLTTEAEIIQSLPIAQATIEALNLRDEFGELFPPEFILNALEVKPVLDTDVLEISYAAVEPELAAAVVNQVMDVYINNDISTNREQADLAREFIIEQLPETEAAVSRAESALRQFKEQNGVVVLQEEASTAVAAIANLDNQIVQTRTQLAETSTRSAELQAQLGMSPSESVAISGLNQAPGVQEALAQLQDVQAQLEVERARYRDRHPTVMNLERQETALQALLQERVGQVLGRDQSVSLGDLQIGDLRQTLIAQYVDTEIQRLGLVRQLDTLINAQSEYQARASLMPGLEKTQRELERQLSAAQTTYETLLTQLQAVQVAVNQTVGNARVISSAQTPENPVSPRMILNLLAGGMVGILLGVAAAFLADLMDKSVKTLQEARELFRYPLLGVIPSFGRLIQPFPFGGDHDHDRPRIVSRDFPNSPVQEAYQMLHANLRFMSSDRELKTIVVTSSMRREGKSEVAANLASAMAQVRRRVLLVDADMRHPVQHHAWDLTNTVGLSNLIVGQVKFSEAVQAVMPSLHVLTAGVVPPNPVVLLDSKRMASLVEVCAKNYDVVIFDTPSLAGTADAAVLGRMTDGVLLVVRPGTIDSDNGKAAKDFLEKSGLNVLGLVANGIDVRNEPDSYFYYTKEERGGGLEVQSEFLSLGTTPPPPPSLEEVTEEVKS